MERVTGGLMGHLVRGKFAQLFIDERQHFLRGFGIARMNRAQQLSDFGHGRDRGEQA